MKEKLLILPYGLTCARLSSSLRSLPDFFEISNQRNGKSTMVFKGQDAWRSHPLFQGLWKSPLPGFRNAVVIYGVYMVANYAVQSMKPKAAITHHH